MMIENEINVGIPTTETGLDELREQMMSVLKMASDICDTSTALVYMYEDSDTRVLASRGIRDQPVVSTLQKISGLLDPDDGLVIIENVRENKQVASQLSGVEMDEIQFFAGALFKNETGTNLGAICFGDSNPRKLSEGQKQQLRVMANGVKNHLMLYKQTELLSESNKIINTYSELLKNSADLIFILEPEQGEITHVSEGVEKELGYSQDMLVGKPFTDILIEEDLDEDTIDQLFSNEKQHKGRYSSSVRFIDDQERKIWFECNFSFDKDQWYVTARDISDKKQAEQGVYELQEKLQKIVSVSTDLIYQLDWVSRDLSWGDELTDVLGYPHTDKFVNYDWWLDKIHPEDLERVIHDVELSVEEESQKSKIIYRIRTYDGTYKHVLNRVSVDRNVEGTTANIVGAIVDISDLAELEEYSKNTEKSLEEKETLLAEIHHRVKNNLAMVSGILQLQAYNVTDEQVQQKLLASTERIGAMAKIHELLYNSSGFEILRIDENIEQLITSLVSTYAESLDLNISFDMEPVELNIDNALPCSLIVNEVITNILKYAYDDGDSGSVDVCLNQNEEKVTLKIRDDGKGLPEDFNTEGNGSSLGLVLIKSFSKQLDGTYSYTPLDRGVEFKLAFDKSIEKNEGSNSK